MKRLFSVALVLGIAPIALAQEPPAIAKYVPPAPDVRHVFVMDSAHILSAATIQALQDSAQALQTETGADVAWITLPTLGGRAIEDATVYLGRTWKIGSAGAPGDPLRNRGLVILYVPDKSKTAGSNFRVEVGKGLQGTVIDSRSRSISAAMREDLRAKHFDDGYMKGWNVAAAMVREDFASQGRVAQPLPVARPRAVVHARSVSLEQGGSFIVFIFVAFIGLVVYLVLRRRASLAAMEDPSRQPMLFMPIATNDDDDDDRRRRSDSSSSWSSGDSSSSSSDSGSSGGGDFGGGGGFDGGGSSDSI